LRSLQASIERQLQSIQSSSWSRSRGSRAMRSSSARRHWLENRSQSAFVGVRSSGSAASAALISASGMPMRCAASRAEFRSVWQVMADKDR
jgi:hypothetical protein